VAPCDHFGVCQGGGDINELFIWSNRGKISAVALFIPLLALCHLLFAICHPAHPFVIGSSQVLNGVVVKNG